MNAAVGLMDGLGLDGDRCIRVIPRQHLFKYGHKWYILSSKPEVREGALAPEVTYFGDHIFGDVFLVWEGGAPSDPLLVFQRSTTE